jgi:hypothetical protein
MSASMTLLLYTTTASSVDPQGLAFARACKAIDERYPLAFSIVATRGACDLIQTTDNRDLVTLPEGRERWPQPDATAARLLLAYAKQFKPSATLFMGSDANEMRKRCAEVARPPSSFGDQLVLSNGDDASLAELFKLLDAVLPAALAVSPTTDLDLLASQLTSHHGNGVALYWRGAPSEKILQIIDVAQRYASGPTKLQLTVHDISKNRRPGLRLLQRLVLRHPEVRVTVVADDGRYRIAGRALSFLIRGLSVFRN